MGRHVWFEISNGRANPNLRRKSLLFADDPYGLLGSGRRIDPRFGYFALVHCLTLFDLIRLPSRTSAFTHVANTDYRGPGDGASQGDLRWQPWGSWRNLKRPSHRD